MGRVPELRFPEFSEEWREVKLGEISKSSSYGINAASVKYSEELPTYLRITDIDDGRFDTNNKVSVNDPDYKNFILQDGDIVFARTGATVGKSYLYNPNDGLLVYAGFLIKFAIKKEVANPYFIKLYTETSRYWKWVQVSSMRSGQPGINSKEYAALKLSIPSLPEQQKIADFLSVVDEKITLSQEKITRLEAYKKGMMQKLLSGELRFPGFTDAWREVKLGEVGFFKSGFGFPEREQGGTEGIPFYKVSDMNNIENSTEMKSANNYVTEEQIRRLKYKPIQEPAIIFAKVGAAIFLERKRLAKNFLLDNNMMAFIPSDIHNYHFIRYQFDVVRLSKYAQVGALPSYNASDLKIIKIKLPSLPEQQKIADFLTAIDDKLTLEKERLEALKRYKQGLLQKMFV